MAVGRGPCSDANLDNKEAKCRIKTIKTMAMDFSRNYNERTEKVLYI
jgi:hypothetical protein